MSKNNKDNSSLEESPIFLSNKKLGIDSLFASDIISSSILTFFESGAEYELKIDFKDEFTTERTIFDFISMLGFDLQMRGTEYLLEIIATVVDRMIIPTNIKKYYDIPASSHKLTTRSIELAIGRAIESCKVDSIMRINKIFNVNVMEYGKITPSDFLTMVCMRFVMYKSHEKGIKMFG